MAQVAAIAADAAPTDTATTPLFRWQQLNKPPWVARNRAAAVTVRDDVLLLGGYGNNGCLNDVWFGSGDGTEDIWGMSPIGKPVLVEKGLGQDWRRGQTWSRRPAPPWSQRDEMPAEPWMTYQPISSAGQTDGRCEASAVALPNGTILVMGGSDDSDSVDSLQAIMSTCPVAKLSLFGGGGRRQTAEVWSSTHLGIDWEQLPKPSWSARSGASVVVVPGGSDFHTGERIPDSVLLIGGMDHRGQRLAEVWKSQDGGKTWQQLPTPPWRPRSNAAVVVLPDTNHVLMLAGMGDDTIYFAEIWSSHDTGNTWQRLPHPPWCARRGASAVIPPHGSRSFKVGQKVLRRNAAKPYENGYVTSVDPLMVTGKDAFGPEAKSFEWNDVHAIPDVILMAGRGSGGHLADIWISDDFCLTWRSLDKPPWTPRCDAALVAMPGNGHLLLMGGHGGGGGRLADVWEACDWEKSPPELPVAQAVAYVPGGH